MQARRETTARLRILYDAQCVLFRYWCTDCRSRSHLVNRRLGLLRSWSCLFSRYFKINPSDRKSGGSCLVAIPSISAAPILDRPCLGKYWLIFCYGLHEDQWALHLVRCARAPRISRFSQQHCKAAHSTLSHKPNHSPAWQVLSADGFDSRPLRFSDFSLLCGVASSDHLI